MIDIPVEDLIFVVCALIGGGLLLITVLLDDILGAIFDFDIGGVSLMPLLLSFISMFGVGGLFATQVLDIHGGQAAVVGAGFGLVGMGIAYGLFSLLRRSEAEEPFSIRDLVGDTAFVSVGIPAGRYGTVLVKKEGQTHQYSATASIDIAVGTTTRVIGVAGDGLIVGMNSEETIDRV
ncbi:MAG: hypothetical protein E4H24_02370 [Thermomicrobiales bacterium]|nr:MAG: hypothetical protein E4H24_02370 [Thermomicrobiales bacterium]